MLESFLNYIKLEKKYSDHTVESYSNDLLQCGLFFLDDVDNFRYDQLTIKDVRSWIASLSENNILATSINRKLAALSSFFKFMQLSNPDLENPLKHIKLLKTPKKLPTFIPKKDMDKLISDDNIIININSFEGKRDQIIIELLYGTGIRSAELIAIKDTDINFYTSIIKITGKGNKERLVPIHTKLAIELKEYIVLKNKQEFENKTSNLIVNNTGNKAYPMFVRRIVGKSLNLITLTEKKSSMII